MTMTHFGWLNVVLIIGFIGAAEEVIRRIVVKPIVLAWRKVDKFLESYYGEPARDGLAGRPGLVDRVIAIEAQNKAIQHELHPNSGSSMRDAIDRTEKKLDTHIAQSQVMVEQGAADKAALWLAAEEHTRTVTELAKAVQIAAQSTPPAEEEPS